MPDLTNMRDKRSIVNEVGYCRITDQVDMFRLHSLILEVLIDIRDSLQPVIISQEDKDRVSDFLDNYKPDLKGIA